MQICVHGWKMEKYMDQLGKRDANGIRLITKIHLIFFKVIR